LLELFLEEQDPPEIEKYVVTFLKITLVKLHAPIIGVVAMSSQAAVRRRVPKKEQRFSNGMS
jgi:hypothetical protein